MKYFSFMDMSDFDVPSKEVFNPMANMYSGCIEWDEWVIKTNLQGKRSYTKCFQNDELPIGNILINDTFIMGLI